MSAVPIPDAMLQHQVLVQRLSASEVRKFAPFLIAMDAEIRKRLSGDELTTFQRSQLEQLLGNLDGALQAIQMQFHNQLSADLLPLANHEAAFSATVLENVITGVSFAVPSSTQLHAAITSRPLSFRGADGGKVLDAFIRDWSKKERDAITGVIRRGVVEGKTNSQMVREIRGTRAAKYNDGLLATTDRHARAVVQTAVSHVSSVARQETYDANADIVKGVQWLTTLDSHVCFVAGTPVQTPAGESAIESLRAGDVVIGGSGQPRRVEATNKSLRADLVRVHLSNGTSATCTADHQWLTKHHGWVKAGNLTPDMEMASRL